MKPKKQRKPRRFVSVSKYQASLSLKGYAEPTSTDQLYGEATITEETES